MIKSAQEAAENAFRERRKWQERINEIELQKNVLQEKEDQLVIKAKELESLTQVYFFNCTIFFINIKLILN